LNGKTLELVASHLLTEDLQAAGVAMTTGITIHKDGAARVNY
jgi:hypothetical protein